MNGIGGSNSVHSLKTARRLFAIIAAVFTAYSGFADYLSVCCLGGSLPKVGSSYDYCNWDGGFPLQIVQVIKKVEKMPDGVLVTLHPSFMLCTSCPRNIFIKMSVEGFVDNMPLPYCCYRCVGTVTYETALGSSKTVSVFEPDEKRYKELCEQREKLEKERAAAEAQSKKEQEQIAREQAAEAERLKKEREDRQKTLFENSLEEAAKIETQEQDQRKKYLQARLSEFNIDPKSHFMISKDYVQYVDITSADVRLRDDERLAKMVALKNAGEWLQFFSAVIDMLQDDEVVRQIDRHPFASKHGWHSPAQEITLSMVAIESWKKALLSICRAAEGKNEHCHPGYVLKGDGEMVKLWKATVDDSKSSLRVYPPIDVIQNICDIFGCVEYRVTITLRGGIDTVARVRRECAPEPLQVERYVPNRQSVLPKTRRDVPPMFNHVRDLCDVVKTTFSPANSRAKIFVGGPEAFGSIYSLRSEIGAIYNKLEEYEISKADAEKQINNINNEIEKLLYSKFVPPVGAVVENKNRTQVSNAKVDSVTAKKDRVALQKALKAIPEADAQKSGDRERRLAKIMQDTTVVKLHEKYTGRKCAELLTEFKREWKEAANAPASVSAETPEPVDDSELQTIDNRIAELKNLCHAWALRKRGLARTPPAVLSAEKEIKELEKKKSAIRMDKLTAGSRARNAAKNAVAEQRNAVYRKYKGMTVDDLVTAIEGCVSGK